MCKRSGKTILALLILLCFSRSIFAEEGHLNAEEIDQLLMQNLIPTGLYDCDALIADKDFDLRNDFQKAQIYDDCGQVEKSTECLSRFLKENPDSPLIPFLYYMEAGHFANLKDLKSAVKSYNKCIERAKVFQYNTTVSDLLYQASGNRGDMYLAMNMPDSAETDYLYIYNNSPHESAKPFANAMLAQVYTEMGEYGKALERWNELCEYYNATVLNDDSLKMYQDECERFRNEFHRLIKESEK